MRIVGGIYKGRKLAEFKGEDIRPTADNVRESLFNILRNKIEGARFLDLFCGTGAVGIEAVSRGAMVTFVDYSRESIGLTVKNLGICGIEGVKTENADSLSYLDRTSERYDVVFIDPPYKSGLGVLAVKKAASVLAENGIIVYENEKSFEEELEGLEKFDERRYGRVYLSFFRKTVIKPACVFAGSFDPITVGHQTLIEKCLKKYSKVVVVVGDNPAKTPFFTLSERISAVAKTFENSANVIVTSYAEHKSDFAKFLAELKVCDYVRGIRDERDMAYEKRAEKKNRALYPEISTVYLASDQAHKKISSSLVREKIANGEDFSDLVPASAYNVLKTFSEGKNSQHT